MTTATLEVDAILAESGVIDTPSAKSGRVVEITIIKAGHGNPTNRHYYPADVLREGAQKFAGAKMYADHELDMSARRKRAGVRSVNHLVGVIRETWWDEATQSVKGKATILRDWVLEIVRADHTVLEVSLEAAGRSTPDTIDGKRVQRVTALIEVGSVDIVTKAGAGGKIDRILESYLEDEHMALEAVTLEDLRAERPDLLEAHAAEVQVKLVEAGNDEVEARITEAAAEAATAARKETEDKVRAELVEAHTLEVQALQNERIIESVVGSAELPEASRKDVASRFTGQTFTEKPGKADGEVITPEAQLREALDTAIKAKREELAEAMGSGKIKGMGGNDGEGKQAANTPMHDTVMREIHGSGE